MLLYPSVARDALTFPETLRDHKKKKKKKKKKAKITFSLFQVESSPKKRIFFLIQDVDVPVNCRLLLGVLLRSTNKIMILGKHRQETKIPKKGDFR